MCVSRPPWTCTTSTQTSWGPSSIVWTPEVKHSKLQPVLLGLPPWPFLDLVEEVGGLYGVSLEVRVLKTSFALLWA